MTLISVQSLRCEQASKLLFDEASFGIQETDKIAVIGPNGCGKSTLLQMIGNCLESPVSGMVTQNGLRVAYLKQQLEFDPTHTIQDHLFQSDTPASIAYREYVNALAAYQESVTEESELAFNKASETMDQLNAWAYESRVSSILSELEISDLSMKMSSLSGGMMKKIGLAQFFFETADLLVLDEPTNHLDIVTIEWLEKMLLESNSAIMMVTHDRYFLNKICTSVFEIDQQKLFVYEGNYHQFLEQREQRYARQQKSEDRVQSVLRVELEWLKRGPKARSTKQKARKDRIDTLLGRDQLAPEQILSLDVADRRLGKKICELKAISHSFDDRLLIKNFSHSFKQGERIGILGPNGAGKTTLLNIIMDKFQPDEGVVDVGVNTVFGYFDQHSEQFNLDQTILEHVNDIGSQIKRHDESYVSASKLLEQFLFPSSVFNTPIRKLSGGEKRRLYLVTILLKNPNFLLFDEPTNDLDIQTLAVLETFLTEFKGCVVVISHDRYFMDKVVDRLFVFKGHGEISALSGSYTDYQEVIKEIALHKKSAPKPIKEETDHDRQRANRKAVQNLEKKIARLEKEHSILSEQIGIMSHTDADYVQKCKALQTLSDDIEQLMLDWELLV